MDTLSRRSEVVELFKENFQCLAHGKWVSGNIFKVGVILYGVLVFVWLFGPCACVGRRVGVYGTPAAPRCRRVRSNAARLGKLSYAPATSIVLIKYRIVIMKY
jgi:hypothetical protein